MNIQADIDVPSQSLERPACGFHIDINHVGGSDHFSLIHEQKLSVAQAGECFSHTKAVHDQASQSSVSV